jgi:hypothetical protein
VEAENAGVVSDATPEKLEERFAAESIDSRAQVSNREVQQGPVSQMSMCSVAVTAAAAAASMA